MSESYFNKKLEPIKVKEKSISQLLAEMSRTSYQGRKLGEAVDVWENMVKAKDLTIVMGLAGSMSTAGQWTIVNWLMELTCPRISLTRWVSVTGRAATW
jgi:deoxyhypusine synthase